MPTIENVVWTSSDPRGSSEGRNRRRSVNGRLLVQSRSLTFLPSSSIDDDDADEEDHQSSMMSFGHRLTSECVATHFVSRKRRAIKIKIRCRDENNEVMTVVVLTFSNQTGLNECNRVLINMRRERQEQQDNNGDDDDDDLETRRGRPPKKKRKAIAVVDLREDNRNDEDRAKTTRAVGDDAERRMMRMAARATRTDDVEVIGEKKDTRRAKRVITVDGLFSYVDDMTLSRTLIDRTTTSSAPSLDDATSTSLRERQKRIDSLLRKLWKAMRWREDDEVVRIRRSLLDERETIVRERTFYHDALFVGREREHRERGVADVAHRMRVLLGDETDELCARFVMYENVLRQIDRGVHASTCYQ